MKRDRATAGKGGKRRETQEKIYCFLISNKCTRQNRVKRVDRVVQNADHRNIAIDQKLRKHTSVLMRNADNHHDFLV